MIRSTIHNATNLLSHQSADDRQIGIRRISVSIQFYQYLFGVIDFYFYFTSGNIKTLILYVIIR